MALRFVPASELLASIPPEPPPIWGGFLYPGAVSLLSGKPKAGKSTLSLAVADAIANDAPTFLGRAINGGPCVYVSEENGATLAHKIGRGPIQVLSRDLAWPKPEWPALVAAAVAEAKRVGAVLLAVDTLPFWAALPPEREKDAGAALATMAPILDATRAGLSVLLVVHERKGGGSDGEGIRGSSAFAGSVDVILELDRPPGQVSGHQRALQALSRYPSTPGSLLIDRDPATGAWSAVGESADRGDTRAMADRESLLAALRDGGQLTRQQLEAAMRSPERQWHGELEALLSERVVTRIGEGKKGSPYRFTVLRTDAAQAPARNRAQTAIDSAAHPFRDAAESAPPFVSAHCAESGGWSDDELEALIAAYGHEAAQ